MSLRRLVLLLAALALVAGPASAAEPAPQITDECGDAGSHGEWNGDSLELEENRPHLDLASGRVAGAYDEAGALSGFTAEITVCGEASATEGGYSLGWSYGDRCVGSVSWTLTGRSMREGEGAQGHIQMASGPRALFTETCFRDTETPLEDGTEEIYTVVLPDEAVTFDGDTVTMTVAKDGLPDEALARLAPGTEWAQVGAISMDQGPSLWAFYGDTEGNSGRLAVRTDWALGGASYVVGEDADA